MIWIFFELVKLERHTRQNVMLFLGSFTNFIVTSWLNGLNSSPLPPVCLAFHVQNMSTFTLTKDWHFIRQAEDKKQLVNL